MSKILSLSCPNCGSNLSCNSDTSHYKCSYCGAYSVQTSDMGSLTLVAKNSDEARIKLGQIGLAYTENEFYERVRMGDKKVIELFFAAGIQDLMKGPDNAIITAIRVQDYSTANRLIDASTLASSYPLLLSINQGQDEYGLILSDNANAKPLSEEIRQRNKELTRRLLAVTPVTSSEPLCAAISIGNIELVTELIQAGFNLDHAPLLTAIKKKKKEHIEILLQQPLVKDDKVSECLLEAIKQEDINLADALYNKGCRLHSHAIMGAKSVKEAEILFRYGANSNVTGYTQRPYLINLLQFKGGEEKFAEIAACMVRHGARLDVETLRNLGYEDWVIHIIQEEYRLICGRNPKHRAILAQALPKSGRIAGLTGCLLMVVLGLLFVVILIFLSA